MGAATDHVVINLTIQSSGLARQGFGIPLILSHTASFVQRIRYYSSLAAVIADFPVDGPEARAAAVIFAQQPHPRLIAIGRAAGTVLQQYDIGISAVQVGQLYEITAKGRGFADGVASYLALADLPFAVGDVNTATDTISEPGHGMATGDGPFRLSTTGTLPTGTGIAVDTNVFIIAVDVNSYKLATSKANALANTAIDITAAGSGTHTLQRGVNDVIIAQLVAGLATVLGSNFTVSQIAGAGQTDKLRAVATAGTSWASLSIDDPDVMSIAQTHASPSNVLLTADLDAILKADQGWYTLLTNYNSSAYVQDAEAWVEVNGRTYAWDTCDSACVTTDVSGGTDVGAQSLSAGYAASMGCYHPSPANFLAAGIMGRWLPTDPGKATAKFKTLELVTPVTLTDSHKVRLRGIPGTPGGRRMNSYEQVATDRPFFWESFVFSAVYKFIDIRRNADFLSDGLQKALLGVLVGNDIVPQTPEGASQLAQAARGFVAQSITQGVLRAGATVTVPAFDDIPQADLDNRNLPGLVVSGSFAGAIHTVIPVDVNLTF